VILADFWRAIFSRHASTGDLGRRGEAIAARYMRSHGYRILGQNLRSTAGEADLLCEDPRTHGVVLVEVKTRRRENAAMDRHAPEVAINADKQRRLMGIARALRRANGWHDRPFRIDVIAVDFVSGETSPQVRHHLNVVSDRPRT
jgi:putative endonuclease